MMVKKWSGIILGVILLQSVYQQATAQSYVESALIFGRTSPGGSARIQGAGGAQVSLGGDYSSALSNPAGLGMYNRSEVTLTPGYQSSGTDATYFGQTRSETRTKLLIPGFSLVLHMPGEKGSFLGGSLGITMTRVNDFNNRAIYEGNNNNSSLIDFFIDDAFGSTTAQFDEGAFQYNTPTGLGYFNYLIGPQSLIDESFPDDEYFTDVTEFPFQREEIETSGGINQWSISYGANFNDKIFVGGGIGISSLRFESTKIFQEDFDDPLFNGFVLQENLEIRGSGLNATVGITARPVNFLQIGASFTTPTLYQLSEVYDASLASSWNNFDYYGDGSTILNNEQAATDIITSDYNLIVPLKFSAGATFISPYGFISADVEFVNPGNTQYDSSTPGVSFDQENDGIGAAYQAVTNFRVGGEFRYEIFRLRAGYGMMGNPIASEAGPDNSIQTISAGAGIRTASFYVDLAWVQRQSDNVYTPYSFQIYDFQDPRVDLSNKLTNVMITLGFTF